jgi:predicted O-linked N-acetylglucosamine transferase (SPINDLY family)
VLIHLNGYTNGANHELFAFRPCPIQLHGIGHAPITAAEIRSVTLARAYSSSGPCH